MAKKALISGASVAGPMTAYWLARHGWDVTIVERADSLRLGGQAIDITDAARDIVRLMGLEEEIKSRHTGEKGLQFVDTDNVAIAKFPVEKKGAITREIEILRGELVDILVKATPETVTYRYGTTIRGLESLADAVHVTFDDGMKETFDVVLAADGMNSATRPMVIGKHDYERYLGCWSSYFTIPRQAHDNDWWRWYTSPTGVIAFLRPDNQGTMRASVNFLSADSNPEHMSTNDKRKRLRARLDGAGWESDRIAEALDRVDDIFLSPLHQIKSATWWRGRCALVGDAAHCPTPYTGMGTTLAIIGAYVLANELGTNDAPEEAFLAYERKFKAFATRSQKLPPGVPDVAYAQSRFKVKLINSGAKFAASSPVQAFASLFDSADKADPNNFDLPDYKVPAA
ncbi:FAD-dependent monooxygenase [Jannaschia donghaensis]|uniref:6-hydroxynicotinate 3-monooxygenase n=1 Tax=Jannaschia donghaensis TaxID=420998 RepID=A0A0M6YE99_9RHOB|nr:FAD-dependent monooxygenase [Jannaschia donghaensis]CTQ48671.1 6-hydroxynicotinate 3-monooxygenase precursor [Jannaschia donghaensis]